MKRNRPLFAAICLLVAGASTTAFGRARFGTLCQQEFEVGPDGKRWQDTLAESWDRCAWFNDELDDTDTKVYYFNLHGLALDFTDQFDQVRLEDVQLVYINTHSGAFINPNNGDWFGTNVFNDVPAKGTFVMWDFGQRGFTNDLYLGNEGTKLSIMANYTCELQKNDGHRGTRWNRAFQGGLRIVLGSHGKLFHGVTTDEVGEDFADYITDGDTLKIAWKDAVSDWNTDQDAAVTASGTGSTATGCNTRKDTMKWQNFEDTTKFPRLKDQVTWLCTTVWDNL